MDHFNARKRETCTLAVLAALAALAFTQPAQAVGFEFDIRGGQGGGFFKVFCPPGTFWRGLSGKAGDILDNIQLLCEGFQTVPQTRPPRKNWTVLPPLQLFSDNTQIGQSQGGAPLNLRCTDFNFVKGIEFNTELFDDVHQIAFIRMSCDHGTLAGVDELPFGFNFPFGTGPQKQVCPDGMWATGLKGRSGFRVDAIALICAEMPPL